MDDLVKICARIREERIRLGMSQQEAAEVGGVTRKTQAAYESGASAPTVSYLLLVAARGIDVQYVMSGSRDRGLMEGHVSLDVLPGFAPADGPTTIQLPEFLLQRKVGMTAITNVRWALNPSRAMEPEIERNQLVLVDVSQSQISGLIDGNTYAYTLWERPDIRRVKLWRDRLAVVGFGKSPESTDVFKDDEGSLEIFGAVVGVL
ncbi:helix-turn-helix domain-containing protein [Lysobacter enzymogenes]|uniref:helix-turn-helix domain-containing protein n=1 Tax=Lysobacter enzymogenes TaxID=69 RepID=UPI00384EC2EB